MRDIFAWFETMKRKQNLASSLGPKRELGVTMYFSEIINLQFGKKKHRTLLCILLFFGIIVASLFLKNSYVF